MNDSRIEYYVRRFRSSVYNAALCACRDPFDADDAAQDVFFRLCDYDGDFNDDEHAKAWLIRCAVNRGHDIVRSKRRRPTVPLEEAAGAVQPDAPDSLLPTVMKLERTNRLILYLYYFEEYRIEEISGITELSVSAVRSRLARARKQLKKLVMEEYGETLTE